MLHKNSNISSQTQKNGINQIPVKKEKNENEIQKLHTVKKSVKDRIIHDRTEFGWSQDKLDREACVGKNTVKQYENGKAIINTEQQHKILRCLDKEKTRREKLKKLEFTKTQIVTSS
jgi:ribosome-binding protein aMBF1 (putative translation factor)